MNKFKKTLAALAASSLLAIGATTSLADTGDQKIDFNTNPIPGVAPDYVFTYDEFGISPEGDQTVVQTDTDNNGVLSDGDEFSEMSLFFTNSFSLNGSGLFGTGQQNTYQILTGVTLAGFISFSGPDLVVNFTSSTNGSMTIENAAPASGPTEIATINLIQGQCVITAPTSAAEGSCLLEFEFSPTYAGTFVAQGVGDLKGNPTSRLIVDINVNDLSGLSLAYAGYGDTCGEALPVCTQNLTLRHDGSAIHEAEAQVPVPGTLGLLGLGLLGLTRLRSRKAA